MNRKLEEAQNINATVSTAPSGFGAGVPPATTNAVPAGKRSLVSKLLRGLGIQPLTVKKALLRGVSYAPLEYFRLLGLTVAGSSIGKDIVLKPGVEVLSPPGLTIGSHTNIGRSCNLDARGGLTIGDNVNISDQVAIWTAEHDIQSADFVMTKAPVIIGDRAWICFRTIVLPGVTLGEGCVVASGSVVTKDVPSFAVVAGIPAKVIGSRSRELTYQLGRPKT